MRKGLNNKGFTLVELLAVVVILALVMGIAASSMLSVMNSSRSSTLHSTAQTAAANLNSWIADDMLATTANAKKLGNEFITKTQGPNKDADGNSLGFGKDTWICLGDANIENITNYGNPANLLATLGISSEDIVIGGSDPVGAYTKDSNSDGTMDSEYKYTINETGASLTCSALRYSTLTGGYEILLIAKDGGKYYVASDTTHYAFSRANAANKTIED